MRPVRRLRVSAAAFKLRLVIEPLHVLRLQTRTPLYPWQGDNGVWTDGPAHRMAPCEHIQHTA